MSDPFDVVQEEARHSLREIVAQTERWHSLLASSSAAEVAEAAKIKASISRSLAELSLDLKDLQSTVDIAARDPAKYKLSQADIDLRRSFVTEMQSNAAAAQAELDAVSGHVKSPAGSVTSSTKKGGEREGLLGGSCSSSSASGLQAESTAASGGSASKTRAARHENSNMLNSHQQQQQEQLELQDIELGGLGETVDRLGKMGRTMNEELKAQGRAFDEFTQEVESTRDRMHSAVAVMNKMMKSKDRGKFCMIIFLTIVLFILMYAVFS